MTVPTHARPSVVGFYIPGDRSSDFDGMDPQTGEFPPSMTKQEFVEECDINNIIRAFSLTRQITHINAQAAQGAFLDLPDAPDFQAGLNDVIRAQQAFAALPSMVRNRFENDPGQFLAFMDDPANNAEIVQLGLGTSVPPVVPSNQVDGGAGKAPEETPTTAPASPPA